MVHVTFRVIGLKFQKLPDRYRRGRYVPAGIWTDLRFRECHMSRSLLLQSVIGHLALLQAKYPKKAASPVAKRTKKYIAKLRRQAA